MNEDVIKLLVVAALSAGAGGAGVHTLSGGETVVDNVAIEHCQAFIDHATRHAKDECDLRIIDVKLSKK